VNQWAKKAVLLGFRLKDMESTPAAPGRPLVGQGRQQVRRLGRANCAAGFRAVPNCVVRKSAYIAPGVVLMPSFVNLGAYVDSGTMVDTWATVGSCAQIGKNVHLSGGVGIGGVLEPMQAGPTIIEDNCFIGARSEVVEGCIVREGSVLGMGVFIGQSTKIVDRETGEVMYGEVPPYSVVVAGSMPSKNGVNLYCAVIVKRVDEKTRSKTSDQRASARLTPGDPDRHRQGREHQRQGDPVHAEAGRLREPEGTVREGIRVVEVLQEIEPFFRGAADQECRHQQQDHQERPPESLDRLVEKRHAFRPVAQKQPGTVQCGADFAQTDQVSLTPEKYPSRNLL
jgi:2,3,4,5-tetrahydropyridine-2-carboxylate N-succinyltransferase